MIGRTLRAVAHLRPAQAAAVVYRRLVPVSRPRRPAGPIVANPSYRADRFCATAHGYDATGFTFVGRRKERSGPVDWRAAEMPRLWRYHLHSFEWLRDAALDRRAALAYVEDWIAANPVGTRDAWEAYPVSRRIGNWIDLFATPEVAGSISDIARASLATHALWLERNLETHLLANHYLENARALMLASAYFSGVDAERWRRAGERVMHTQLREQILSDGGHVERSPMYHALVLEALLDLVNIAVANPTAFSEPVVAELRAATRTGLAFLAAIVLPDGSLPLFNDAAHGIAQPASRLFAYGVATGAWPGPRVQEALRTLAASGYYVVSNGADALVVDCGELGPAYQCGHGHADTLAYELMLGGRLVVSDAGVFGYDDDERRRYARSAAAHSTITIDGAEPCELWGAFRVGRRAHPLTASLRGVRPGSARFVGSHDGFRRLTGRPTVTRTIDWNDGTIVVTDRISSAATHTMSSRITLAAGMTIRREPERLRFISADEAIAELTWDPAAELTIADAERYTAFGAARPSFAVVLTRRNARDTELSYRITSV